MSEVEIGTVARLTVERGPLTEFPLAERVTGGFQNGVTFYPDEDVVKVQVLWVRAIEPRDEVAVLYLAHRSMQHVCFGSLSDGVQQVRLTSGAWDALSNPEAIGVFVSAVSGRVEEEASHG